MCHIDGEFWVERQFPQQEQEIDMRARSDSLFPRLAVAGGPRALALVHRGRLLLGRHPRQGDQSHQTATKLPPVALPASEAGWATLLVPEGLAGGSLEQLLLWAGATLLCLQSTPQKLTSEQLTLLG